MGCQDIFQIGIVVFVHFIHHLVFEWNVLFWKVCSFPLSYDENGQEPMFGMLDNAWSPQ